MLQVQRCAALALTSVLSGTSLNAALDATWRRNKQLTAGERGAIQDISYGTLRHLGTLRAVLDQLASRPVANGELKSLLLAALYQLEFSDAAPYAIVDHAVECAVQIGGAHVRSFANAVLRNFQRRREELLARAVSTDEGRFSYAPWWIERARREFGLDAVPILESGNQHPPMTLRVNARRHRADAYLGRLREAGIDARQLDNGALMLSRPVPVGQLPGFEAGDVSVQDAGAQLAAPLLDALAGMRVLDACAAPGGKTAHLLEIADVEMTAIDDDPVRLQRVRSNLDRLGLDAKLEAVDAGDPGAWWDGKPFDRVLLDAPCSGSGVVRRHPDIKWLRRAADIAAFAQQQRRLLDALWNVLARDGKLLYATCSIFSEENRAITDEFAARHPDARILGGMPGRGGLLLPDQEHDGFYYCLLQKQ
ncbi:MAG TPA: 16S rRNA (cytosine(967)-C(5))-methyltransferase RsmB [Burkholderiales bacterium]|nr:16S rRNA (cytosine(967)-C(5))-methyltransferase RsmB [Burkholderiales bacterium]